MMHYLTLRNFQAAYFDGDVIEINVEFQVTVTRGCFRLQL